MKVVKDLIGGSKPQPIELPYNGDVGVDSVTKRYAGSLAKVMDAADIDKGVFCTFAGEATAMLNVVGILEEEQGLTGNYVFDDATYGFRYRKITPVSPFTAIEAEYSQADAAGTNNTDTGASGSAAATTLAAGVTVTQYTMSGGWIYFLTGANAGYLHYVTTDGGSDDLTLSTALANAVISSDTLLCIRPPMAAVVDFDATYTSIKSELATASNIDVILGLSTWISAPGIAKTKLARDVHDGCKIVNAKFYHQFTLPGSGTYENAWISGIN